jgi:outer membrane protein OmpA-like peptidoglycan-associated protein
MTSGRTTVVCLTAVAAVLGSACARPRAIVSPQPVHEDVIVLLPDADGSIGRATVTTAAGTVELAGARASTVVLRGPSRAQPATAARRRGLDADLTTTAPPQVRTMSEADVRETFGSAIGALPPAPQHFTLFFRFNSEELTDESRTLVGEVLETVKARPFADVVVRGHTDTTGAGARNFTLGLKRANAVRTLLVQNGLDRSSIDVASHGESELLVPTADNTFEPRNRRVEITVR